MGFDARRPVPWKRLLTMFGVYAVIVNVVMYVTQPKQYGGGVAVGTLVGGAFYLALAALMAKFGWAPKSMKESREARAVAIAARQEAKAAKAGANPAVASAVARNRPAPTRRTASGVGRRRPATKR